MKRHSSAGLSVLLVAFVMGSTARAQEVSQNSQGQVIRLQRQPYFNFLPPGQRAVAAPKKAQIAGAWWTNTALVQQLGLTDDQKAKIERAFENHRQNIVASTELLEKEEAQLARLLEADPVDRNAVLTQIDRVVQARGEMERANSAMTLEMREYLTRGQWMQLQGASQHVVRVSGNITAPNLISQVPPVYPEAARQSGIQGVVVLQVEITKEGLVGNVRVVSGHPLLTQAALDAVKQWRYRPTFMNNEPVPVVTTVMVNFPFRGGSSGERGAPSPSGAGQRRGRGQQ